MHIGHTNIHTVPCVGIEHIYSHAVRHTNTHWQDSVTCVTRRSGLEPGGRARRKTPTVGCVGDSRTPRPARSPLIAGPLAAVGGVVTVRGCLPVTVPRPGDRPGSLARGCYEPSPRQRRLRCWRICGDGLSSPPGLGLGRGGGCGGRTLDSRTIPHLV